MTNSEYLGDKNVSAEQLRRAHDNVSAFMLGDDYFNTWNEIERFRGTIRIWLRDASLEIPPPFHADLKARLGDISLEHVQVSYVHSLSEPQLQ